MANKKKLFQSDDAAGDESKGKDIAMTSETYKLQMIAAECEQTIITAESIYMDMILVWEWSATKLW